MEIVKAKLPTKYGNGILYGFNEGDKEHCCLVFGEIEDKENILCRVHSSCLTGDVFHSLKCDCGEQLEYSLKMIAKNGGILIYLSQEGRGIGLLQKIKAYSLQDEGYDTVEAQEKLGLPIDARNYKIVKNIMDHFHIQSINLITNNPDKIKQLKAYGVKITGRINIKISPNNHNKKYLKTKKEKMGHDI